MKVSASRLAMIMLVLAVVAVISFVAITLVVLEYDRRDSRRGGELALLAGDISSVSSSVNLQPALVGNYSNRMFEVAPPKLREIADFSRARGWLQLAEHSGSAAETIDEWRAAMVANRSEELVRRLRLQAVLQLQRSLDETRRLDAEAGLSVRDFHTRTLTLTLFVGAAMLIGTTLTGAFFFLGFVRPMTRANRAMRANKPLAVNLGKGPVAREVVDFVGTIQRVHDRLEHLAQHDPLTGLPNRLSVVARLEAAVNRARRSGGLLAVLFIDIDRFKEINDTLGHVAGDRVLLLFSEKLKEHLREVDTIGRLGGDEFVVLTEGLSSVASAELMARKLLDALMEPIVVEGKAITIDASVGVAVYPDDGPTGELLLRNADAAMYQAKSSGRGCYRFYSKTLTMETSRRFTLGQDIRAALSANQLELHYQPRVDLRDGSICGVEALLRWRHPKLGLLQPDEFLPDIEQASGMTAVDTWATQQVCLQIRRWVDAGHTPPRVSINISAGQLSDPGFVSTIKSALGAQRLGGESLELELTESVLLTNPAQTVAIMKELQDLGVIVSIDDFGTGYSSLSYLQSLPLDTLKIDRAFVASLPRNRNDAAIVRAILALSEQLNLCTVAEGVENSEQARFLAQAGCQEAQGFYFARPMSGDEVSACFRFEHFRAKLPNGLSA